MSDDESNPEGQVTFDHDQNHDSGNGFCSSSETDQMEMVVSQHYHHHHHHDHNHGEYNENSAHTVKRRSDIPTTIPRQLDPEWDEERQHFQKIVATFSQYKRFSNFKLNKTLRYLSTLPDRHQDLLRNYGLHLNDIRRCIDVNQNLFRLIVSEETSLFENQEEIYPKNMKRTPTEPTSFDFDKLQAVLKQILRDWSAEGEEERASCYTPIIEELETRFGHLKGTEDIKILVPGAGMGRLAHEIVRRGYVVEGNEFSLFMLFASNFILNKCWGQNVFKCYPWIHQNVNVLHHEHQIRGVLFPDIDPCELPAGTRFSMTAGDFLEVYKTPTHHMAWDCLVTCFFIDCANNIVSFLERIYYCLKRGGTWINLGPLLYHYADMADEDSIEPSFDFLLEIIKNIGFIVEKQILNMPTKYADNRMSLLCYSYKSIFLVCKKPESETSVEQEPSAEPESQIVLYTQPSSSNNHSAVENLRSVKAVNTNGQCNDFSMDSSNPAKPNLEDPRVQSEQEIVKI